MRVPYKSRHVARAVGAVVGLALVLSGCVSPAPGTPTSAPTSQPPNPTPATGSPRPTSTPTTKPSISTVPEPSASPLGKLRMSNRTGGDITFSPDFCTATVPITWYPLIPGEVVAGVATIEITGPGDAAGITTVDAEGDEVHLVVDFPLGKVARSWNVDLLQVGDRLVNPAPADAKGSRYSFTGPGGNCPP